jgi:hypothetical protein
VTSTDTVKSRSARDTLFDMVRSLGLIAVIVAVTLIFVPGLLHPSKSQKFQAVDYSNVAVGFRQVTGSTAFTPVGLSTAWKATSESLIHKDRYAHLHIGFAAPNSSYAGLEEAVGSPSVFITSVLGAAGRTSTGTTQIAGRNWAVRTSSRHELALTTTERGVTIAITGSATRAVQSELAAALRQTETSVD